MIPPVLHKVVLLPAESRFEFQVYKHELWRGFKVMTRWLMLRLPWLRVGINQFHEDSHEDALHNHSVGFWSVILWGSYEESVWYGLPWENRQIRNIVSDPNTMLRPPDQVYQRRALVPRWIPKEEVHGIRNTSRWTVSLVISGGADSDAGTLMYSWPASPGNRPSRPDPWPIYRPYSPGPTGPEPAPEPKDPDRVPDIPWKE